MKNNTETEVYAYAPIIVEFKELGYNSIRFQIRHDSFWVEFQLHNKTIDDIKEILLRFCEAYEIEWEILEFETSGEIFNNINKRTLANEKTIRELFELRNIKIKETK